jgi:translin
MNDARKEFTEANVTLAVISGGPLPRLEDLGVDPSSYLNGMAEVIGELRRYILDRLRSDEVERCQEMMEVMDEIYGVLVTVDFPEAVTGGLRHTTDAMRGIRTHPRRPDRCHAPIRS